MQAVTDTVELGTVLLNHAWPLIRIGAMLMVMPAIGAASVPMQVRALAALAMTLLIAPMTAPPSLPTLASIQAVAVIARELLLGFTMGFILKLVFDAVTLGGQAIAMSMGLGFAVFIDNARGVNVPVLGQFLLVFATLIFLSLDGHLQALALLAASFDALPIGFAASTADMIGRLLTFSAVVFSGAIQIALPAVTALLIANIAFGVMSRAAPTLNLFAVGFPVSLLFGLIAVVMSMDGFGGVVAELTGEGLSAVEALISAGAQP